jgi:hypothetical protein
VQHPNVRATDALVAEKADSQERKISSEVELCDDDFYDQYGNNHLNSIVKTQSSKSNGRLQPK